MPTTKPPRFRAEDELVPPAPATLDQDEDSPPQDDVRSLTTIGRCVGCTQMARLDDGVCAACLALPGDARRWAKLRHRARTDAAFARACYERLADPAHKRFFRELFGDPFARELPKPRLLH